MLTVSAGEGHNSISRAVAEYILHESGRDNIEVKTYDLFKGISPIKSYIVNEGYFFVCKHFCNVSSKIYEGWKVRDPKKNRNTTVHKFTKSVKPHLTAVIRDFKPDAVFCAHVYCAQLMADLKAEGVTDAPAVSVITDYDVQPFTETSVGIDYIITPHEDFNKIVEYKGFRADQICVYGIPVASKFSRSVDKCAARRELGLDDKFTVLLINGGIGFGNTIGQIKNLSKTDADFQIISICGRNKKLKKRIDKLNSKGKYKRILNFGYVNNVDFLMSAADCVIGKIGGVGINEAFNKGLPIIANTVLPWQEYNNMLFLKKYGACDYIERPQDAYMVLEKYIKNPFLFEQMISNVERIRKPQAFHDAGELLIRCADEHMKRVGTGKKEQIAE